MRPLGVLARICGPTPGPSLRFNHFIDVALVYFVNMSDGQWTRVTGRGGRKKDDNGKKKKKKRVAIPQSAMVVCLVARVYVAASHRRVARRQAPVAIDPTSKTLYDVRRCRRV